jgi:hypothetical protein
MQCKENYNISYKNINIKMFTGNEKSSFAKQYKKI